MRFDQLGLSPTLLMTLEREGYTTPTPIQAQAIPHLLNRHDLLGIAQTGTGKTAAFALPILQHILSDRKLPAPKSVRALILSPTRELASQIADSFKTYSRGMGLAIATIYGGVKYGPQYKSLLGGLDILVATPGRLIDHIEQKTVDLRNVEFFVLDEADQMLDLGFVKPIRQIAARMTGPRQNLFFSATMPKEIGILASELLKDPKKVEITPQSTTVERVTQNVLFVEALRKRALLSEMFADEALNRTLVFTRTKHGADKVTAYLQAGGIESAAIHGDKNQSQRERALQAFRAGKLRALVATDIAARGIDVDDVSHVINYELPNVPEAYVHRIGRTARAGKTGVSISLCSDDERKFLKEIERVTRQRIPSFDRRKDAALKLLDEAILASGVAGKPKTPDRLPEHRKKGNPRPARDGMGAERRHSDPDAEFVHKRQRNRPGQKDRAKMREQRPERYDPMTAERGPMASTTPINFKSDKPQSGRKFGQNPFKDEARAEKPRGDRPFSRPRNERRDEHLQVERPAPERPSRDASPAAKRDYIAATERPRGEHGRPNERPHNRKGKPAGFGGKPFAGKPGGKFGGKPGFKAKGGFKGPRAEGDANRSEGAQFKRRGKANG